VIWTASVRHTCGCSRTTINAEACRQTTRSAQRNERSAALSTPRIDTVMLDRSCGSMTFGTMWRMPFARLDEVQALRSWA